MNPDRAVGAILTVSVVAVLTLGLWLLWDAHRREPLAKAPTPAPATALPPPSPSPQVAQAMAVPSAAAGHRLAGTVVGDIRFAIIEDPSGANALYRPGQTVPGLGELVDIAEDHVTLRGGDGSYDLRLAAAPTTTATPPSAASPTPPRPTRTPRLRDQSASESSP